MKKFVGFLSLTFSLTSAFAALPAYEPFADATASGGTTYTPGSPLIGQTNSAAGFGWSQAGPGTGSQTIIEAGNLTISGLAEPTGNSIRFGGNGTSTRFNFNNPTTSGTLYYSFAFRLTDITGLSATGVFWAGLNNSSGTQSTTPSTVGTRIVTKSNGTGFQLGLDKSAGTAANFVFDPTVYNVGDTFFVVASYTFNTGSTSDDVAKLWINPSSVSFGAASAPGGELTSTAGNDLVTLASFVAFNRIASQPAGIILDELRVGASWADVTPVPEPSTVALAGIGACGILFRWMRRK